VGVEWVWGRYAHSLVWEKDAKINAHAKRGHVLS
jgi:hypothetical protein